MDATPGVFTKCGHVRTKENSELIVDSRRGSQWTICKPCRRAYERERQTAKRRADGASERIRSIINDDGSKACTRCKAVKPPADFPRDPRAKGGRGSRCRPCGDRATMESRWLKKLGPVLRPTWRDSSQFAYLADKDTPVHEVTEWLTVEYLEKKRSLRQLARDSRVGLAALRKQMKANGIPIRDNAEAIRLVDRSGAQHYAWQAKGICPRCKKNKKTNATLCKQCFWESNSGENNPFWAGDNVGYAAVHARIRAARGPASTYRCEHCEHPAAEWAYDHRDPDQRYDEKLGYFSPFSLKLHHYVPLCKRCHRRFDREQIDRLIRVGGADIVESDDPPRDVTLSFFWLAQMARNNADLWVGVDGSLTIRGKATYQVVGISPDFKGLMCRRIDTRTHIRKAA